MTIEEKRQYPRLNLQIEDGYFGNFKLANDDTIVAPILNIGASGLKMLVPQSAEGNIKEGDRLQLTNIAGGANITFLSDVQLDVRWIKPQDTPGYMSAGCELKDLPDDLQQQLIAFVDTERMSRGQYN
jgi:c-di-GMP-binding flagellar brake protein YcgR